MSKVNFSIRIEADEDSISVTRIFPERPLAEFFGPELSPFSCIRIIRHLCRYIEEKEAEYTEMVEGEQQESDRGIRQERERDKFLSQIRGFFESAPRRPGVYAIRCTGSGKSYVGATKNLATRIKSHAYVISSDFARVNSLCKDNNSLPTDNNSLYADLIEYGIGSLKIDVLEVVDSLSNLHEREKFWTDKLDSVSNGYNPARPVPNHTWKEESPSEDIFQTSD